MRSARCSGRGGAVASSIAILSLAPAARATTYHASPNGTGTDCTQAAPCDLMAAAATAMAGDTVLLATGVYHEWLEPMNSGTASAWVTFQADCGALPIIDGAGVSSAGTDAMPGRTTGVGSDTATYLRFVGIVTRNWESGFSNGWTGMGTTNSNGHFQFINCIADGNSRNGFAFNSATGLAISQSLSAHNGFSTTASWSSGVQLYEAQGTYMDNVVQQTVSFENADMQNHTDGSGFIVDQNCTGATFVDDIGFGNGGSCIRLTKSTNTHIINTTCYHDGLDPADTGPTNPGEIYFTDATSRTGLVVVNNLAAASGSKADAMAFVNPPTPAMAGNYTINSGATAWWVNPPLDFHLTSSAMANIIDKGTTSNAPSSDVGFDPKCIKAAKPANALSWWQYSIDYDYISAKGAGVAGCFNPGKRPAGGGIDIGAYEMDAVPAGGTGGAGGICGAAGSGGAGGVGASDAGVAGRDASAGLDGGAATGAGGAGSGSDGAAAGGSSGRGGGGAPAAGSAGGASAPAATGQAGSSAGCACGVADTGAGTQALRFFVGALLVVRIVRRRRRRHAPHRKGPPS